VADIAQTVALVLPSPAETLLLSACLLEGRPAREAWDRWREPLADPTDTFRAERAHLRALGPLLNDALARHGGDPGSREMSATLKAAGAREELREASLRRALAETLRARESPVVVKGAVLAETVYPRAALRHTHDLDLLVDPDEPEADETHPSGVPIRRHPRLFRLPFDPAAERAMRERLVAVEVAGAPVRTLTPDDALVHVCAHAFSLAGGNLARWVPDAWFLLRSPDGPDWDRLLETAARGRLAIPLSCLLGYLADELGAPVPSPVLEELAREARAAGPTERDVALSAAWQARRRSRGRGGPPVRRRLTLARWALAPAPGYLRATGTAHGRTGLAAAYATRPWRALGRRARHAVRVR
jgi:hypothetical protein